MNVLLKAPNELEKLDRVDSFGREIIGLATELHTEGKVSPLETAALILTTKQINSKFTLPSHEQMTNDNGQVLLLATEDLKSAIADKWKQFVEAIKKIYARFKTFIGTTVTNIRNRIKSVFGKGAKSSSSDGAKSEQKKEESNTSETPKEEQPTGSEQTQAPEPEKVTGELVPAKQEAFSIDRCYIDMGKEANLETLAERLKFYPRYIDFVLKVTKQHSFNTLAETVFSEPDNWQRAAEQLIQGVLDSFADDLGAEVRNETASIQISTTVKVSLPLEDHNSYLTLSVNSGEEVEIDQPSDVEDYRKLLTPTMDNLYNQLGNLSSLLEQSEKELGILNRTDSPILKERILGFAPVMNKRLKFITDSLTMVDRSCMFTIKLIEN